MNILQINTFDNKGGAAKIAWHLREELEKQGHTSPLYVGIKCSKDPGVHLVKRRRWQTKLMHLTGSDLHFTPSDSIMKTEEYKKADIIHCHNLHSGFFDLSTMQKMSKEKPVIWTIQDLWPITAGCTDTNRCATEGPRRFFLYLWDMRKKILKEKERIYKRTDMYVVAGSKWMKSKIENSILKDNKQAMIYDAIDVKLFQPNDKNEARKQLGLPLNKKIILFASVEGYGNYNKGWGFVKQMIDHYKDDKNIVFLCIGGTPANPEKNVIYTNYIEDTKALSLYYSASDVFLYPSLAESFGLVVAEAMSCGTPAVIFRADALPEIVDHKKNGYVAEYKNFDDLLIGLQWILSLSPETMKKIGEDATKKIAENFSLDTMVKKYIELYEKVINEKNSNNYKQSKNGYMNTSQKIKGKLKTLFVVIKNKKNSLRLKFIKITPKEQELIDSLRQDFTKLSASKTGKEINGVWSTYCDNLKKHILEKDPRNFLNWDVIAYSMFYEGKKEEFDYLKSLTLWPAWKEALKETLIGNPKRYREMPETSGNMVHYSYHLALLAETFHLHPRDMKQIFEFGGGYGGMTRLFFNLGFNGAYYIFDLPEFTALQKYYLRSTGIQTFKNTTTSKGVSLIDKIEFLQKNPLSNLDILIATWSLSETPIDFRNKILSLVKNPNYYLISYQGNFKGINNTQYFTEFEQKMDSYEWKHFPIKHLPGNYYLLGKKK